MSLSPSSLANQPEHDAEGSTLTAAGQAALVTARAAAQNAAAYATLRAYRSDWQHFLSWCEHTGFQALPAAPATIGAYLASLEQDFAPTTIQRRLAAIAKAHRFGGYPWDSGHRDLQGSLRRVVRRNRPAHHPAVPKGQGRAEWSFYSLGGSPDAAIIHCQQRWRDLTFTLTLAPVI